MAITSVGFRDSIVYKSGTTGTVDISGATVVGSGMDALTSSTFTSAASVSVNNIFSSKYENYRIVLKGVTSAQTAIVRLRTRILGVDTTTSVYSYGVGYVQNGGMARLTGASSDTGADIAWGGNQFFSSSIDIIGPNLVAATTYQGTGFCRYDAVSTALMIAGAYHTVQAVDGFTLYPISGTFSGSLKVYGYRN